MSYPPPSSTRHGAPSDTFGHHRAAHDDEYDESRFAHHRLPGAASYGMPGGMQVTGRLTVDGTGFDAYVGRWMEAAHEGMRLAMRAAPMILAAGIAAYGIGSRTSMLGMDSEGLAKFVMTAGAVGIAAQPVIDFIGGERFERSTSYYDWAARWITTGAVVKAAAYALGVAIPAAKIWVAAAGLAAIAKLVSDQLGGEGESRHRVRRDQHDWE